MDDPRQQIAHNVQLAIAQLGPASGIDFGLDRASVAWVEGYIERLRDNPDIDTDDPGGLIGVLGSFLGECVAVNAGGSWHHSEEHGWCVRFANGDAVFPFAKVAKQFAHGLAGGDSILSFYDIAVAYVATGRLRD